MATKRRKAIKNRRLNTSDNLEKIVRKNARDVNNLLNTLAKGDIVKRVPSVRGRLQKNVKIKVPRDMTSWASKQLVNRLDTKVLSAWNKQSNKVVIKDNLSVSKLMNINKALEDFKKSKLSTKQGISEAVSKTKESLQRIVDKEIDYKDVNRFYEMLTFEPFQYFVDLDFTPSDLWITIQDAKENNDSEVAFIKRLEMYAGTLNDLDDRFMAKRLYDKYVVK